MKKKYLSLIKFLILIFFSQNISAQTLLKNSVYKSQINSYLEEVKTQYSLTGSDLSDLIISKEYYSSKTKITHVYLVQRYQNIEIFNSETSVALKDNKVFYYSNRLQPDVLGKINTITPNLSAEQAIDKAATHFSLGSLGSLNILENKNNKEFIFSKGEISKENIPAKLVFLFKEGQLKLCWDISIYTLDSKHWWSVRVDAVSGEILDVNDWVVSCNFGNAEHKDHNHKNKNFSKTTSSFRLFKNTALVADGSQYNVFPLPAESPNHGGVQIVNDPADAVASPFGWHDTNGATGAEFTITRGNNVFAKDDISGDDLGGSSPDGGATLNFNFPYNFNTHPRNMIDATTVNLFYMNNMMHDVWYHYGFDEDSGNFQENNYGNSGLGNDSVNADAQDGSGFNNANFGTPPDGGNPRMQMFLWSPTDPPGQPLTINNGSLAGDYTAIPAGFGPPLPTTALTSDIILVEDTLIFGTADPNDACDAITNGASLSGKIALIRRGECEFGFKVLAAQNEGAAAVIIVNNVAGDPITMSGGADGGSVTIPSIMVSQTDGEAIIAELSTATVNGSLIEKPPFLVDADLDNGIIAHEYGHGISNRLTGGANNSNCLSNNEQMGEGWSDWFALMVTMKPSDLPETGRGIGTYSISEATDGLGIRPTKYSTDFNVNNFTYNATNDVTVLGQDAQGNDILWNEIVHNIGFVWATVLWDLTWAYVDKYGFDPDLFNGTGGNNRAMQIVIDGLKLQPCSPGFVDGRDAILAADMALTNGEDQCMIWEVFAKRGLGVGASQGTAFLMVDQVEDFAMPDPGDASLANCTTLSTEEFNLNGYKVYPNPTNDKLFIRTSVDFGEVKMKLIDLNGRIVLTKKVNLFGGEVDIDISRLQSGMYILNVKGQDININSKVIKN